MPAFTFAWADGDGRCTVSELKCTRVGSTTSPDAMKRLPPPPLPLLPDLPLLLLALVLWAFLLVWLPLLLLMPGSFRYGDTYPPAPADDDRCDS